MLKIGKYQVRSIVTDLFRLDGGAMFGSVPKVLWSKLIPADEKNRIQLACRLLVLTDGERQILIDCGMGSKWTEKEREIYAIEPRVSDLHHSLPGITDVILTHLHFDHCGGVSYRASDNTVQLTFPDANHHLQGENLRHAATCSPREKASYLKENIDPLTESGKLRLLSTGEEILPDIFGHVANGHTRGLQWISVRDGGKCLAYPSDLIPTSHHLQIPYVMGYDICAETSMTEKTKFLEQAVAEGWIVVFEHDAQIPAARIGKDGKGRFIVEEKIEIPLI